MTEEILRLKPLVRDEPGKYVLTVFMPFMGGMGMGVSKIQFLVDKLHSDAPTNRRNGFLVDERGVEKLVVSLPMDVAYMMVSREQYEMVSLDQMKEEYLKAHKEAGGLDEPSDEEVGRALSGGNAL